MDDYAHLDRQMQVLNSSTFAHNRGKIFEVSCKPNESLELGQHDKRERRNIVTTLLETRASAMANAMAMPSLVLVPRPSSSMITLKLGQPCTIYSKIITTYKLRRSTFLRMKAISLISAANVETLVSMLSSIPNRANSWCCIGNEAYVAGTLQKFSSNDNILQI
jgi:hypothetical protein